MELQRFRTIFNDKLTSIYPKTEIDSFFFILMKHQFNFEMVDVFTKPTFEISEEHLSVLEQFLERLSHKEPIQYLIGKTDFYGLEFLVNAHTLIPRPETEELVEWIQMEVNKQKPISILDIGTGSGCIAISLKKNLSNSEVFAIDFSSQALEMAKKNALLNNVGIDFILKDILKTEQLPQKYDVIVSNPPYVRELEKQEMNGNVLDYEPHSALFVNDDNPLVFYDKISDLALNHLNHNGILYFEINEYLGQEMRDLLIQKGFINVELKKDIFGKDRMLRGVLR